MVDEGLGDLQALQKMIDSRENPNSNGFLIGQNNRQQQQIQVDPLEQLQLRSWLLHWSLFVLFKHPDCKTLLPEFFLQKQYLHTIQVNCPHLLRYVAAVSVISKSKYSNRLLLNTIEQERDYFKDPITDFLYLLYKKYDFDGALNKLSECETVLSLDYFLNNIKKEFMSAARGYIFEMYTKVHATIDTKLLSSKLQLSNMDAEKWIVDKIRSSKKINAKIDYENHQILIKPNNANNEIYLQVTELTKDLTYRTQQLTNSVIQMMKEGTL